MRSRGSWTAGQLLLQLGLRFPGKLGHEGHIHPGPFPNGDRIDKKYIQQFMYETLKTPSYLRGKIKVNHSKHTTEWAITCKGTLT